MKKRLFVIFTIALMMLFASCTTNDSQPPSRGYWDGETFVSPYFGLRFELPDGWTVVSNNEGIALVMAGILVPVAAGAEISDDVFDALEGRVPDVLAVEGDIRDTSQHERARMSTIVGRLADDAPSTAFGMLLDIAEQASNSPFSRHYVIGRGAVRLGMHYWNFADQYLLIIGGSHENEDEVISRSRIFKRYDGNGFFKQISITYHDDNSLHGILAHFRAY